MSCRPPWPATRARRKRQSLDDAGPEAIHAQEKALEALVPISAEDRRAGGVGLRPPGLDVHAVAAQAPCVFGWGPPHFGAAHPGAIAVMMQFVLDKGYEFQPGDWKRSLEVGHVDDVADFFLLLLQEMIKDGGQVLPRQKVRIVYPSFGTAASAVVATKCLDAAYRKGLLPKVSGEQQKEVRVQRISRMLGPTSAYGASIARRWQFFLLVEVCRSSR